MGRILTLRDVEAALRGGAVFAAGGGGWSEHGRMLGTAAVNAGAPELVSMDEVPDDAWVATAAAIGAPGDATAWQMLGVDYVKAVQLLQRELGHPWMGMKKLYLRMVWLNRNSPPLTASRPFRYGIILPA